MKNEKNILNKNSFITIESSVLLNENLTNTEKILYGYIVAFSQVNGYCNMKTSTMCNLINIKERQLRYCLSKLKRFNYISTTLKNNIRYITPTIVKFIEQREEQNNLIDLIDYDWLNDPDF